MPVKDYQQQQQEADVIVVSQQDRRKQELDRLDFLIRNSVNSALKDMQHVMEFTFNE